MDLLISLIIAVIVVFIFLIGIAGFFSPTFLKKLIKANNKARGVKSHITLNTVMLNRFTCLVVAIFSALFLFFVFQSLFI